MALNGPLLLVGCGKMGAALLSGWLAQGIAAKQIIVVEPNATAVPEGVTLVADVDKVAPSVVPDVVVLAIKPQVFDSVLPGYRRFAGDTVFLSIAAGQTLAGMGGLLGDAAVVRAMPNTPAAVGRGISVLCGNDAVTAAQRTLCQHLLEAVGVAVWADDEGQIDAVTAVSGSGPAYVFLLVEAMAAAGVAQGLAPDLAMALARQTVIGSGCLMDGVATDAETLRRNVTSPAGTTAAALDVLMADDGLKALLDKAVAAATARSRELAK